MMLIDLRKLREPLRNEIRKSLVGFANRHSTVGISSVGLFGDGFHGSASLHLDTPAHSAAFVEEWAHKGPNWFGEDEKGRFCNNCWDFAHCIGEYSFPNFPDLYQHHEDSPVDFVTLDGTKERAEPEDGDEGLNDIVFPFLKVVLAEFEPFAELHRTPPFRVGVQMRDSLCEEFWLLDMEANNG